ncbi:MAG: hypothetical protein WCF39_21470 [Pseudolabrys sp.]
MQRLLHIGLDVAIMALIVGSFVWGGYASKTEPTVVGPAQAVPCY